MTDRGNEQEPVDIQIDRLGNQIHIMDQGKAVAVTVEAKDGRRHRLIAPTSAVGHLVGYLTRARTKAIERLEAAGIDHQIKTTVDADTMVEPKSVNLGVARDRAMAVLQIADAKGGTINVSLAPNLVAALAQQMSRAAKDMSA